MEPGFPGALYDLLLSVQECEEGDSRAEADCGKPWAACPSSLGRLTTWEGLRRPVAGESLPWT